MKYDYLIFDIDDTVLDFFSAFSEGQKNVAARLGITVTDEYRKIDEETGWKAWRQMRLDDTEDLAVQEYYHEYYREYLRLHYEYLSEKLGISVDPSVLSDIYLESVSSSAVPMEECTADILRALSFRYKIVFATNGLTSVQTRRTAFFAPFLFRLFISEEMKAIKPTDAYFAYILDDLGCRPSRCLMIGDSLTNDIIGAKRAGMDVCFYDPRNKGIGTDIRCDLHISSISELKNYLLDT